MTHMSLRSAVWTASALVPVAMMAPHAQERVAQDVKESRSSYQELIDKVPVSCVKDVMDEAAKKCPAGECKIPVPNSKLSDADSCDPRNWVCVWPTQRVGENVACPSGWTGTYSQDRLYELRNCGKQVTPTDDVTVLSSTCTRVRTETKVEACPTDVEGGHWTGAGVTSTRQVTEKLEKDLITITPVSAEDWKISNVDCRRDIEYTRYKSCDNLINCYTQTSPGGVIVYADTCNGTPPTPPRNVSHGTAVQTLDGNLVVTLASWVQTSNPEMCPGEGGDGTSGDASGEGDGGDGDGGGGDGGDGGDGGGDGCPLVIDLQDKGIGIVPLAQSTAKFNFKADIDPASSAKPTAWYDGKTAIIARDLNGNGMVDDIREVFGGTNLDGFDDLAKEDSNKDGVIDAKDPVWKELRLWVDANSNAISEKGEMRTFDEAGVQSIELISVKSNVTYEDAYIGREGKVKMKDGSTKKSASVFFTNASAKKHKQ